MFVWIRFGERPYELLSTVDEHEGEYAISRFFHVWYLPLIPTRSLWVKHGRCYPIDTHWKSVGAVYARLWAPLAAIAFAATSTLAGVALAVPLVAASVIGWRWRRLPAARHRRSDFNAQAFGLRCEPERMKGVHRAKLRVLLETSWAKRGGGRSPDDVATHGPRDADEAVLAYGLLRLAAAERGIDGSAERAAAERILRGDLEPRDGTGPYRDMAPVALAADDGKPEPELELDARIEAAAVAASTRAGPPGWTSDRRVQLGALAVATVAALVIAAVVALPVIGSTRIDASELTEEHVGELVTFDCDHVEPIQLRYDDRLDRPDAPRHEPVLGVVERVQPAAAGVERRDEHHQRDGDADERQRDVQPPRPDVVACPERRLGDVAAVELPDRSVERHSVACTVAGDDSGKAVVVTFEHRVASRSVTGIVVARHPHHGDLPLYDVAVRVDDGRVARLVGAAVALAAAVALWAWWLVARRRRRRRVRSVTPGPD